MSSRALWALPVLAVAALGWWHFALPAASPDGEGLARPPSADHSAQGRVSMIGDSFGITEAVTIPELWIKTGRIAPADEPAMLAEDARLAVAAGAKVVRANSAVYPYLTMYGMQQANWDWTRADNYFKAVGDAGLDVVVVLGPWPGTRTAAYTSHYLPDDMHAYEDYVRKVVERYDGDGKDDMPGLRAHVIGWEIDNEPDLHNSRPPAGADPNHVDPASFETPAEYAKILVATARVIRDADPHATVLSGGLFAPNTPSSLDYLRTVFNAPGARDAFDVLSIHCYYDQDSMVAIDSCAAAGKNIGSDKPFWITETSVPADGRVSWADETWQGKMVAAAYGGFLADGAQRIFWHTLSDPPSSAVRPGSMRLPFATNSLYRSIAPAGKDPANGPVGPGSTHELKPAGLVYQRLVSHLAKVQRSTVSELPGEGGRVLKVGDGWLVFWGEPRTPAGAKTAEDLLTGQTAPVGTTVKAPAWLSKE